MTDLAKAAADIMERAYAPYSNYLVGAAIRTAAGNIYVGCNVENAAYPLGNCAESSAICAMISAGEREITEIFIMTRGEKPGTPCGGCRQRLAEFADSQAQVHCGLSTGETITYRLGELLPHSFDLEQNKT